MGNWRGEEACLSECSGPIGGGGGGWGRNLELWAPRSTLAGAQGRGAAAPEGWNLGRGPWAFRLSDFWVGRSSCSSLCSPWLLSQASPPLWSPKFPLTPSHGQGLFLPQESFILSFPPRNATASLSPRRDQRTLLPQLRLHRHPNWSRPWVGEARSTGQQAGGQAGRLESSSLSPSVELLSQQFFQFRQRSWGRGGVPARRTDVGTPR